MSHPPAPGAVRARSAERAPRARRARRNAVLALVTLVGVAACGSDDEERVSDTAASEATLSQSTSSESTASEATVTEGTADAAAPPASDASDSDGTSGTSGTSDVATTADAGQTPSTGDVPAGSPARIVSLSPTATEMLFAIGAGDQVVAVDDQSNFPEEALDKQTDLSGFTPNVEAIAGYDPDLVLIDGTVPDLQAQLEGLGLDVWVGPAAEDLDDIYEQIEQLGASTGRVGEAAELVAQMQTDIEAAVASAPDFAEAPTYFHELDSTLYTVTSGTFIGSVYQLFGLRNIADTVEGDSDYPQLSAEFVISQDPDIIFLADANYGESPETVAARDGWSSIAAVQGGHVVPVDADIASRWGPRIVDYVELVAATVDELAPVAAG